jgi:hypothetical protein
MGILTWLESKSRWSKLRELGQSSLVRSSVLMPVFGYLLLLNEQVHAFLVLHQYDAGWPFNRLPSLWRLWLLFYGSFSLAIGSILFSLRCPTEIKRYAAPFDLAETTRNYFSHTGLARDEIAKNLELLYDGMSQWESSLFKMPRLKHDQRNLGAGGTSAAELNTGDPWGFGQIQIWSVNDIKRPVWRIIIFVLLWTGLFLVGFPAAITFLQVTFVAAKHLIR